MADFTKHQHTSTSSDSMGSMDMGSSSSSMIMNMNMVFFTSTSTPLYSSHWAPKSLGQYAGTCIFLIVLGFIFRLLLAWKQVQEHRWARRNSELAARFAASAAAAANTPSDESSVDEKEKEKEKPVPAAVPAAAEGWGGRPWRFSTDLPRAALTTVIAGVGYLIMLAVMTMNVGYFMSTLAGVFVGELAWGRYVLSGGH
ncbi:low affinity copper transporter [Sphaerosporella brunnea]|uniref:Copper transport protein n=1 Tax=Sphaerosporella brunnea TaxID=1250544 RepID=A0A5J5ERI4_9PEZI|nr:low affinity copper transporter [Sphaerosporella brunnea]